MSMCVCVWLSFLPTQDNSSSVFCLALDSGCLGYLSFKIPYMPIAIPERGYFKGPPPTDPSPSTQRILLKSSIILVRRQLHDYDTACLSSDTAADAMNQLYNVLVIVLPFLRILLLLYIIIIAAS